MAPVRGDDDDVYEYFEDRDQEFGDRCGVRPVGDEWCEEQLDLGKSGVLRIVRAEIKRREKARTK